MLKVIKFNDEKEYIDAFLSLPSKLYTKYNIVQNKDLEEKILSQTQSLSDDFKIERFLVVEDDQVVTRAILTIYPNDENLYFGFFESYNNQDAVNALFDSINQYAKERGFKNIVGPVDCSFWIKYRLKINKFENPYFGEPYNLSYYHDLLNNAGLKDDIKYVSNSFKKFSLKDILFNKNLKGHIRKYSDREKNFLDKDYIIKSPNKDEFAQSLLEIYDLITILYSDFPAYKTISKEAFLEEFSMFEKIGDPSMIKIAYYNNKAVAFVIGFPDYTNMFYKEVNTMTLLKVLLKKIRSKRYVFLYLGALPEHKGLGKGISKNIITKIFMRRSELITALIKEGKVTKDYGKGFVSDVYEYVLLSKEVI